MEKESKTLKQVILEEFGEVIPYKGELIETPIQLITDEELVGLYGGFWEKLVCGTVLVNVEFLRKWAINSTFSQWFVM